MLNFNYKQGRIANGQITKFIFSNCHIFFMLSLKNAANSLLAIKSVPGTLSYKHQLIAHCKKTNLKLFCSLHGQTRFYCSNSSRKKVPNSTGYMIERAKDDGQLEKIEVDESGQKYEIISKKYSETSVPGSESGRKYSGLTKMQKDIISSNQFNLADPSIVPKTGSSSSFAGLSQTITQISLGKAKIRQQNEVFLSEVDPFNIPADLEIRFDTEKEIRIIGTTVKKEDAKEDEQVQEKGRKEERRMMKIEADTVEHKGMSEFMEREFNGLRVKTHYGKKRYRRMDLLFGLLIFLVLEPVFSTLNDYYWTLDSIREVQKERMKEITNLKQRSYVRVLFNNRDFYRQI